MYPRQAVNVSFKRFRFIFIRPDELRPSRVLDDSKYYKRNFFPVENYWLRTLLRQRIINWRQPRLQLIVTQTFRVFHTVIVTLLFLYDEFQYS